MWVVAEDANGKRHIAKPIQLVFEEHNPSLVAEPTLTLSGQIGQTFLPALHTALTENGFGKSVKDESVEAIKYHLEDMRALVFEKKEGAKWE
jgi:hypothetical protein